VGAAFFDVRMSGYVVWFATVLCTLKAEKQDTSHILMHHKRANENGNLIPLSIVL
jgi:hypothetical protein